MRLNRFDIVEIGLPVLYNPILIARDEPVVTVGPRYCSNGDFVSLIDISTEFGPPVKHHFRYVPS